MRRQCDFRYFLQDRVGALTLVTLIIATALCYPSTVLAQTKKKMTFEQLCTLFFADTTLLEINGDVKLVAGFGNDFTSLKKKYKSDEKGRLIVNRPILLYPTFDSDEIFSFGMFHFKKDVSITVKGDLYISGCEFDGEVFLATEDSYQVTLSDNRFHRYPVVYSQRCEHFSIDSNEFFSRETLYGTGVSPGGSHLPIDYEKLIDSAEYAGSKVITEEAYWYCLQCDDFTIGRNRMNSVHNSYLSISVDTKRLSLSDNVSQSSLIFNGTVDEILTIEETNAFYKDLVIKDLVFTNNSEVDWDVIGDKLGILYRTTIAFDTLSKMSVESQHKKDSTKKSRMPVEFIVDGTSPNSLAERNNYKQLLFSYKKLYDTYKTRGDIESANSCFIRIKDLEGRWLQSGYEKERTFRMFFKLNLNRLMKFYTNHATDPALAMLISFYIILGFSLIYFIYPSEWDVNRKSEILRNFKDFIKKNDKGYFKPFLKVCFLFFISFINALMLSLNSFVTLGFGNIPTKGIARYMCIIQGFMGWFLLSIFTVALFNQVLL